MAVLDQLRHAGVARVVKNQLAGAAFPQIYKLRGRIPRYNIHEQAKTFARRAEQRGLGDVRLYHWYHTVDLGGDLITPGTHDYRRSLDEFHFPENMSGMNVLDVGSATGFFAFEFEKRGAHVVSVELPSIDALDRFPSADVNHAVESIRAMTAGQSAYTNDDVDAVFHETGRADFYHRFLDGPFRLCHKALDSRVERRYATVYDLGKTDLGTDSFDLVFLGDLLLHVIHPLQALASVAALCSGTLVISQHIPAGLGSRPAVLYVGGDTLGEDHSTWWFPNRACFEQILRKLGFRDVRIVGRNTGVTRPGGTYYDRPVLHAMQ